MPSVSDRWKPSRHVQPSGHVLRVGTRRTAVTAARDELGAAIPERWYIAEVTTADGQRVGFGLHADLELAKLAVETCFWPLYEVENGVYKLTYKPKEKKPLTDWITPQGRFRHLKSPNNKHIIDELQAEVDKRWEELLKKSGQAAQESPTK